MVALKISKNVGLTDVVSSGTNTNPISTQHPITGSQVEQRLWLFNDKDTERFENINIDPTDSVATDESTWVQLAPDNNGSAGIYLAAGAALSMANISDNNVAKPFWVKVTSPVVADVANKTDIKLTVNFRRFAV